MGMRQKLIAGKGFLGIGIYQSSIKRVGTRYYNVWNNMIKRCYCEKQQKINPSYIGCSVDSNWWNFQIFAEWFTKNYVTDFVLDKDILIKGNKIYGPNTCCFVPKEINAIFTKANIVRGIFPIGVCKLKDKELYQSNLICFGKRKYLGTFKTPQEAFEIYKINKENYIKEVANKWKSKISEKVYQALINYKVEITD